MIGYLYRYPHPLLSGVWIYSGQGKSRDKNHRSGRSSFGRRFRQRFPGVELPRPILEAVEVRSQLELNEEETIWMFRYHTWCGYEDGMNLTFPGSDDYKGMSGVSWLDPERRPKQKALLTRLNQDPKFRANNLVLLKRLNQDAKFRARQSSAMTKYWREHPEEARNAGIRVGTWAVDTGHLEALRTPEHQLKAGKAGAKKANQLHKKRGTGRYSSETQSRVSRMAGPMAVKKKRQALAKARTPEHQKEAGHAAGLKSRSIGTGIFAMTPEQKSEIGQRSGRKNASSGLLEMNNHRYHVGYINKAGVRVPPKPNPKCRFCSAEGMMVAEE